MDKHGNPVVDADDNPVNVPLHPPDSMGERPGTIRRRSAYQVRAYSLRPCVARPCFWAVAQTFVRGADHDGSVGAEQLTRRLANGG